MAWDVAQLRHNASMLYNHLCSDDADRVYVDRGGRLQLDNRSWFWRLFSSLGDSSREATDTVAIRTLRRVLNAVEAGTLNPNQIIIQERVPVGMFMDEGDVADDWKAIKGFVADSSAPLVSDRPDPNRKWLNKDKFAMNIGNANRFKTWQTVTIGGPRIRDEELAYEQLVDRKVTVLTQQILHGRATYQANRQDSFNFYDASDTET